MPDDLQERLAKLADIESRLKRELDEARARYDHTNREFAMASARASDLGLNTIDGAHALHQASKAQTVATSGYGKAVERFCDFILHGKLPED